MAEIPVAFIERAIYQNLMPPPAKIPWISRHALWIVGLAPLLAQIIGSAFNIWYNRTHIWPLLTSQQWSAFLAAINTYNLIAYPFPVAVWVWVLWSLHRPMQELLAGCELTPGELLRARQRVLNLPWWAAGISAPGWLLCIPVFLGVLHSVPGNVRSHVFTDLTLSILIAALIALTHACFFVEVFSQRLLYPVFFRDAAPVDIPGTHPISLRGRGVLWVICVVVCPTLLLLMPVIAPDPEGARNQSFAVTIGALGITYGLASAALLLGHFVVAPVQVLRAAAGKVAGGDLNVHVDLMRSDEFGPLVSQFNQMVSELRDKQRVVEIFGQHVGRKTARQILERDPGLGGVEKEITVMFADIRDFTARSSACTPQEGVALLNRFLAEAVAEIEKHGGIVNKFLGDGFMAIFGAAEPQPDHALRAVESGCGLLVRVRALNESLVASSTQPLQIGIGIHTGAAIVGSIGAPARMEYTAIGDTVNVASRVESLTKEAKCPLLFTAATFEALPPPTRDTAKQLPPMSVKGKPEPLIVYML